jgi:tyrosyl-tRNA synthetase
MESSEIGIINALVQLGFAASKGEAKRKIAEGAVKADDVVISNPDFILRVGPTPHKISLGKKKHGILTAAA